jgi:negative regulator of sigma E activity
MKKGIVSTCDAIAARLSAYLDDELSPNERETVRAHLTTCARCRAVVDELSAVDTLVRGVLSAEADRPSEAHENIARVIHALRAEPDPSWKMHARERKVERKVAARHKVPHVIRLPRRVPLRWAGAGAAVAATVLLAVRLGIQPLQPARELSRENVAPESSGVAILSAPRSQTSPPRATASTRGAISRDESSARGSESPSAPFNAPPPAARVPMPVPDAAQTVRKSENVRAYDYTTQAQSEPVPKRQSAGAGETQPAPMTPANMEEAHASRMPPSPGPAKIQALRETEVASGESLRHLSEMLSARSSIDSRTLEARSIESFKETSSRTPSALHTRGGHAGEIPSPPKGTGLAKDVIGTTQGALSSLESNWRINPADTLATTGWAARLQAASLELERARNDPAISDATRARRWQMIGDLWEWLGRREHSSVASQRALDAYRHAVIADASAISLDSSRVQRARAGLSDDGNSHGGRR